MDDTWRYTRPEDAIAQCTRIGRVRLIEYIRTRAVELPFAGPRAQA